MLLHGTSVVQCLNMLGDEEMEAGVGVRLQDGRLFRQYTRNADEMKLTGVSIC